MLPDQQRPPQNPETTPTQPIVPSQQPVFQPQQPASQFGPQPIQPPAFVQPSQQPPESFIAQPSLAPKSHKWLYIGIIASVVGILAIAGGTFFALKSKNKSANSNTPPSVSVGNTAPVPVNISKAYDNATKAGVSDFSASKKNAVLSAYQTLTAGFSFKNTNASPSKQLVVLGIAYQYSIDQSHKDALRSLMYLAYIDDLKTVPNGIDDKTFHATTQTDSQTIAVLKKYEDSSLSGKVQSAITNSGLESDVKRNLRLASGESLTPYTVIAMNFNAVSTGQQTFAKEHYMYGATPKMWVELLNNHTYVLMAKDYATSFVANPNGSVRSTVIHEFTHGQNPFVVGDLGRNIEERRAEYFSGDKSAYYDSKQLFIYTQVFSGTDILKLVSDNALDPYAYYVALYKQFGVTSSIKLIASRPVAYLSQASGAVKKVQSYTGGSNGFIRDMIAAGSKDSTAMESRVQARYSKLLSVLKTKDAVKKDLSNNLGGSYQMPDAANEMLKNLP